MVSTYLGYLMYARDMPRSLHQVAAQPIVARDKAYFDQNVGKVKSADDLLKNFRLFSYAMKAYGLQDMTNARALMKKVMESDLTDPKSFANQLSDVRYRNFAAAFNFTKQGTIASSADVQSDDQQQDTLGLYTMQHASSSADAATATQYYDAHIGDVTSVDQLLSDGKLYNYVLSAYGIAADSATQSRSDVENSVRQALESDPNDPNSFANKQSNVGFKALAASFNFDATGNVELGQASQSHDQEAATTTLYTQHRNDKAATADAAATAAYQAAIGSVTSVDNILNNSKLYNYALKAVGLDPATESKQQIKWTLESDLSNPASFAGSSSNPAYAALAAAFNFNTTGTIAAGSTAAQTASQTQSLVDAFTAKATKSASDAATAATDYQSAINSVASVDDLLSNDRLYTYALTAYGLDPATENPAKIRAILDSDLSDPASFANTQSNQNYRDLAAAFNFGTDGNVIAGKSAQSSDQLKQTTDVYAVTYNDKAAAADAADSDYFTANIGSVRSLGDLLADGQLYSTLLSSVSIDPTSVSTDTITQVLTSDLSDPNSFANKASDKRYGDLASLINFSKTGAIAAPPTAQSAADIRLFERAYTQAAGSDATSQANAKTEGSYYATTIATVQSVGDLLNNSRLVSYVLKATGFGTQKISNDTLQKILTSNLSDPKSFANKSTDPRYRDLAAFFNFSTTGTVSRPPSQQAQTANQTNMTDENYVEQTMELQAGDQNQGVRLALYFQHKAASITNPYTILADKALLQVVQTALGLPSSSSQANIDVQARNITNHINLADFQDPKKLQKFLARFATLYDLNNGSQSQTITNALQLM